MVSIIIRVFLETVSSGGDDLALVTISKYNRVKFTAELSVIKNFEEEDAKLQTF